MPAKKKGQNRTKPTWKDIQSKVRKNKRNKLAILVLALVAGLLIASWVFRFTQSLFSPWQTPANIHRKYTWNGEFNINLLIRTNHISVLSFSPKEEKVVIVNIPDETFLEVPHGFGFWQLRAIYELGESQKNTSGYQLLSDTLTNFLAIPIDGFLDFGPLQRNKSAIEIVDNLRKNPFFGFNLLSDLKTDLTIWELIKLDLKLTNVRFDKVMELNLDKLKFLDRENLPDGTPVFTGDPVKLDSVLSDLVDPVLISEHKSIAVFNATKQAQLAQKAARLITNLGGNVIITANASQRLEKTQVQGEQSLTLKRLRQIFDLDCQNNPKCDKIDSTNEDIVSSRAQVNLFLGEDYFNRN